jgi:hypothetical protein
LLVLAILVLIFGRNGFDSVKNFKFWKIKISFLSVLIALIPLMIFQLSNFIQFSSVFNLFTPWVYWWNPELTMTIRQFLGMLLGID